MISYELNANNSVSVFNDGILVAIYNAPIIGYKASPRDLVRDLRYSLTGRIPAELIDIVISNAVSISETGFIPGIAKLSTSH